MSLSLNSFADGVMGNVGMVISFSSGKGQSETGGGGVGVGVGDDCGHLVLTKGSRGSFSMWVSIRRFPAVL